MGIVNARQDRQYCTAERNAMYTDYGHHRLKTNCFQNDYKDQPVAADQEYNREATANVTSLSIYLQVVGCRETDGIH